MNGHGRPDPEELLAQVRAEEERAKRGKLTIFFGSAPGVGKTYAMLEAARMEKEDGRDVVVGIVETHGRYDTGALVLGHELLPKRRVLHKGIELEELDLDAALARRPGLIVVDELAHTNAPDSRHAKRWQDVEELLDAGLDVFTTLNVQHLESLGDVVAQITHVIVRETVPDRIFEAASDVRLMDLPIDELLERLREGKIYAEQQAALARQNFFQPGNLIALRELALRMTAQRVDAQMREYRTRHGIDRTWPVTERLLVSVSPSPGSETLIRAARRLAASTHSDWIVAYVETPSSLRLSAASQERIQEHLRLALSLGAETVTLAGERAPDEIVRFAKSRNVTRILVGKPTHPRWRDYFQSPFLDELVRSSGDVDVHVLSGEGTSRAVASPPAAPRTATDVTGYAVAFGVVAVMTLASSTLFGRDHTADVAMAYLLGVTLVALRWGLRPSLFAGVLSVLAFDFFFVPPYFTFAVADLGHVVTFAVMLFVGTLISSLTTRVREQADAAREREMRTASLYALSRGLAAARSTDDAASIGGKHVANVFDAKVTIFLRGPTGQLEHRGLAPWTFDPDDRDAPVAEWVWQHGQAAGLGTDTLPSARALFVPLEASGAVHGVLALIPSTPDGLSRYDRRQQLDAFVGQVAAAVERAALASQAHEAQLRVEAEEMRNALLSSVSHDLRTPLAVITGTASTLLEPHIDDRTRIELTQALVAESERLNRVVRNLLDMTRLDAGAVRVHEEWQPIEEAIGAALDRTSTVLGDRPITTSLDDALVPYDSVLLQQVLVNLLENASKYTPAGSPIEIHARRTAEDGEPEKLVVSVLDRGPGLAPGDEQRIFEKFYRADRRPGGVGLGLTICKGIIAAHGGAIWAENREGGGVVFRFTLPIRGDAPAALAPEPNPPESAEVKP